jgi:hypothetical protein
MLTLMLAMALSAPTIKCDAKKLSPWARQQLVRELGKCIAKPGCMDSFLEIKNKRLREAVQKVCVTLPTQEI